MAQFLNEKVTTNTNSDTIDFPGGPGAFMCRKDSSFSGATFQLQFSLNGTAWSDVPGAQMTIVDDDMGLFQLPPCRLRVNSAGGEIPGIGVDVLVAPCWQGWFNDGANLPGT